MWQSQSPLISSSSNGYSPFQPYPQLAIHRGKHKHDEVDDVDFEAEPEQEVSGTRGMKLPGLKEVKQPASKRRRPNSKESEAALSRLETLSLGAGSPIQQPLLSERERDGTPFPIFEPSPSSSRKALSTKKREKNVSMQRYDPSRPHVIFVDTLSDSDDEDAGEGSSVLSLTDDEVATPSTSNRRAIKLNNRLRDQIRRQHAFRVGPGPGAAGPWIEEMLADSGVQERGLVLYRPPSWSTLEETDGGTGLKGSRYEIEQGPKIEEISEETPSIQPQWDQDTAPTSALDCDVEMDVD